MPRTIAATVSADRPAARIVRLKTLMFKWQIEVVAKVMGNKTTQNASGLSSALKKKT
jgi:hypothetical protein